MKRLLFLLMLLGAPVVLSAQEATPQDSVQQALPEHILFEGVEMKGDIYDFSKALQKRGFKLEERDGNSRNYIFRGDVCGRPTQFMVSFTRKTKTVYRIMAQLKNAPITDILAALNAAYGEPFDINNRGYQWQVPGGGVMLGTPEGYDPTLVVMDAAGVAAYKEEN